MRLINRDATGQLLHDAILANAGSHVAFSIAHHGDREELAKQMFQDTFNPDEVKHKLYSPVVKGYYEEYRRAYSESRSVAEGHGASLADTAGATYDDENELINETLSASAGESWNRTDGQTESHSLYPVSFPEIEERVSTLEYRSLDEQLHRAMAALFDQDQRQCAIRLPGMRAPAPVFIPWLHPPPIREPRVEQYLDQCLERCSFARSVQEADQRIEQRHQAFEHGALGAETNEPEGKRRLR